jgi:hypothetical protein
VLLIGKITVSGSDLRALDRGGMATSRASEGTGPTRDSHGFSHFDGHAGIPAGDLQVSRRARDLEITMKTGFARSHWRLDGRLVAVTVGLFVLAAAAYLYVGLRYGAG